MTLKGVALVVCAFIVSLVVVAELFRLNEPATLITAGAVTTLVVFLWQHFSDKF